MALYKFVLFAVALSLNYVGAYAKGSPYIGVYCGDDNCYTLLELDRRTATENDVKKAYLRLSKSNHPDKNGGKNEDFVKITLAYDILRDPEAREEYHEFMDHPERFYKHYSTYVRRQVFGQQENVWSVLLMVLLVATILDYLFQRSQYKESRRNICADPNVQDRVRALRGAQVDSATLAPGKKGRSKSSRRVDYLDDITDAEIIQVAHIDGWKGREPGLSDLLIVRMVFWPWILLKALLWACRWILLFYVLRRDYGEEERIYLIRFRLNLTELQWKNMYNHQKEKIIAAQIWDANRYALWRKNQKSRGSAKALPDDNFIDD